MTMTDEQTDSALGGLLDEGGTRVALMTPGEYRVARFGLHMISLGDGPGAEPARELVKRLDRRAQALWPDADWLLPGYGPQHDWT